MRVSLPSSLLAVLFLSESSLVAATASRSACLHIKAEDFAQAAACGDKGSLRYCLGITPEFVYQTTVERCFIDAGCTGQEAQIEAKWILEACDKEVNDDLKRRIPEPTPAPTPALIDFLIRRDSSTTTQAGTLQCSTATTIDTSTCPIQSTGVSSGHTLSCFPTQVATSVCAAGLICQTDASGNNICMHRQDGLTTSGAVITFFLVVIVTIMISAIVFLCCRDRQRERRAKAKAEAALIAKTNAAAPAARPRSISAARNVSNTSANAPLMAQTGQDPFADGNRLG